MMDAERWPEVWEEVQTYLTGACHFDRATNLVSQLATVAGESGPAIQDVVELYVLCLRGVFGHEWFDWLWKQTPMKRIGGDSGWHKLGDGGVPYALLHSHGVCIRRSGLVECHGAQECPVLPPVEVTGF